MMMVASFLLGSAEVLRNNSSQTFMPEVVQGEMLAKGNGQMWSAEYLTNSFIGPALGSLLLGIGIYLPFLFDAGSFFASAALIGLITVQGKKIARPKDSAELKGARCPSAQSWVEFWSIPSSTTSRGGWHFESHFSWLAGSAF
jgi:hypothetical protein